MKVVHSKKEPQKVVDLSENKINWLSVTLKLILTVVTIFAGLWMWMYGIRIRYCVIPFALHCLLLFYGFAVNFYKERQKERYWRMYVKKYGNKHGVIPPETRMMHEALIKKGGKIQIQ